MMITLVILGILVGIVVLSMMVSKTKAQESSCKANLRIIESAIQQYCSLHDGELPDPLYILSDEGYIGRNFDWTCPAGDYKGKSGDYGDKHNYNPKTGEVTCPHPGHQI